MSAGIEGGLSITLRCAQGRVDGVGIGSTRPLQTPRIFVGKSVEQLLSTLPLLYSVCGTAQACAAVEACEQAMGLSPDRHRSRARYLLVWFETAKEHLWRILLDWPGFLGEAARAEAVAEATALMAKFRLALFPENEPFLPGRMAFGRDVDALGSIVDEFEALLNRQVFEQPVEQWLSLNGEQGLERWILQCRSPAARLLDYVMEQQWSSLGQCDIGALPELGVLELEKRMLGSDVDAFIQAPSWQGACFETDPFTRQMAHPMIAALISNHGNGLLPRLAARLVELASIPGYLRSGLEMLDRKMQNRDSVRTMPGTGIAQVEAARGRLVHRVELDGDRVQRYQVLAPTEWNFHPQGVLAQGLKGLAVRDKAVLRRQTELLINAIDPCVGYQLQID